MNLEESCEGCGCNPRRVGAGAFAAIEAYDLDTVLRMAAPYLRLVTALEDSES